MLHIIKHRAWFLSLSILLVVASIVSIFTFGIRPAIDFTGGTLWQIKVEGSVSEQMIADTLRTQGGVESPMVYRELTSDSFLIKTKTLSQADHQRLSELMRKTVSSFEEMRFESIGPTVGEQLRTKAIWAVILVLFGISLYIAFAFRKVSHPVASWKYGIATLIALFHDAMIPIGILAVLGYTHGIELDTNFIVALLVIIGFSVHDTIVVFDRIRENLITHRSGKHSFDEVVNMSINQTMARSINTSLTLVLVLIAMLLFGAHNLFVFTGILLIGTIAGTYSSIFIASPLLTLWHGFDIKKSTRDL